MLYCNNALEIPRGTRGTKQSHVVEQLPVGQFAGIKLHPGTRGRTNHYRQQSPGYAASLEKVRLDNPPSTAQTGERKQKRYEKLVVDKGDSMAFYH